jgi:hypothetical protein
MTLGAERVTPIDPGSLRVRGFGGFDHESFEDFLGRWPSQLANFPEDVIREWVWRHSDDFYRLWSDRGIERFAFERRAYDAEAVLGIGRHESWDDLAERGLDPNHPAPLDFWLGRYMIEHGTFPTPIIVAVNSDGLVHPRNLPMRPNHIIEGHRRLGMLRGLIGLGYQGLRPTHAVWELTLPPDQFAG